MESKQLQLNLTGWQWERERQGGALLGSKFYVCHFLSHDVRAYANSR